MRFDDPATVSILGDGARAAALRSILGCAGVWRTRENTGWEWPTAGAPSNRFVVVMPPDCTTSEAIRWHADAWACPYAKEICCAMSGISEEQAGALIHRDVFGCGESYGNTFHDWANYVALVPRRATLTEMLTMLSNLRPCLVTAWHRCADAVAPLPGLVSAIAARDYGALKRAAETSASHDWNSVCCGVARIGDSHEYSTRITRWLQAVATGTAFSWQEGSALFAALSSEGTASD